MDCYPLKLTGIPQGTHSHPLVADTILVFEAYQLCLKQWLPLLSILDHLSKLGPPGVVITIAFILATDRKMLLAVKY
ncbi:hypothetical protein Tco_1530170 [Tanacetum coccineum]